MQPGKNIRNIFSRKPYRSRSSDLARSIDDVFLGAIRR